MARQRRQTALNWADESGGPVECLGLQFDDDAARREHFLQVLRDKLQDASFRATEGFPAGDDADILALSDPPYHTACPNPFLADFIRLHGKPYDPASDTYHREPFAADVSEGKNAALYRLPSYHTKVPPAAIKRYVQHYTQPGDIVLDAFCGTGMTGLGSLLLANDDGARHALLIDLSPAAAFTAAMMCAPIAPELARGSSGHLGAFIEREIAPAYTCVWNGEAGVSFDYAVWSDWGICSECDGEFRIYDVVADFEGHRMLSQYQCPHCGAALRSDAQPKAFTSDYDPWLGAPSRLAKTTMVLLSRKVGNRAVRREATDGDAAGAREVGLRDVPLMPAELPYSHMTHERNNLPLYWGITHIHHFYTRRNYWALSRIASIGDAELRRPALFAALTILENSATRRNRFYVDARRPSGSPIGPLTNTLYVPTVQVEANIASKLLGVLDEAASLEHEWVRGRAMVSTQSATSLSGIPDASVDFVFTDPPFGGNINYSEQNLLAEWWLRVFTNRAEEAITNPAQHKGLPEYQAIMTRCFSEYHRVLKPGRWMVVVFHNSMNSVWVAIQQALEAAGFVVAVVNVFDKVQSTLHQDHKAGAVDKDLAITVYKPSHDLEKRFGLVAGTATGVWDFVREHIGQLPVFLATADKSHVIAERQDYLLFDRMVAFHVQRGVTVPISAGEFYSELRQRFPERDGMFFLPEQVTEYDRKRLAVREVLQLQLFVTDESSAIQWLRQQLTRKPQTFQELQPQFMRELTGWLKHEKTLELSELLDENFLCYEGEGEVPGPIHAYLSSNYHDLRNLAKDDPELIARGKNRWYVPDTGKEADLERLRHRALMKEFRGYQQATGRLRVLRTEALRAGFKELWGAGDYAGIVTVAERVPERVIQEDPALLMYYDNALMRTEG